MMNITLFRNAMMMVCRQLMRRKFYFLITMVGLSMGLSICIVIWRYSQFELSYDSFHKNAPNIYRVMTTLYSDPGEIPHVGWDLAPALKDEFPEIRNWVRVCPTYDQSKIVTLINPNGENQNFSERNIQYADSTFFEIFTFDFLLGDPSTAFHEPSSVVITESTVRRYFPDGSNPIGRMLRLTDGPELFQITGVIRDVPQNTHLSFEFLFNSHYMIHGDFFKDRPRWDAFFTYIAFAPFTNVPLVEKKMDRFLKRYQTASEYQAHPATIRFQPILSIHTSLTSPAMGETDVRNGIPVSFYILLSLLILAIAWINYVNLSTARAFERAKEVGIKKTVGVTRGTLIRQFLFESVFINFISLLLAIGFAFMLFPIVSGIVGKTVGFNFADPLLWITLTLLWIVGSVISGIYPAFIISSFQPAHVVKGWSDGGDRFPVRQVLVVFQFAASLLLITGTLAIDGQLRFMAQFDTGMDTNHMFIVYGPKIKGEKNPAGDFDERMVTFKNELLRLASVKKVAGSEAEPGGGHNWETHVFRLGAPENEVLPGENMNIVFTEPDLIDTYGFQMLSGKVWELTPQSNMSRVIINEAAIKPFGLGDPERALHQKLVTEIDTVEIVGVLRNFHWHSLKTGHVPMMLWPTRVSHERFSILLSGDLPHATRQIETLYRQLFPDNPFISYFLNDFFNRQYSGDRQFAKVFRVFAIFALMIACLGLFGLVSFTTASKKKEISIRKVLGASMSAIVILLSGKFLRPVVLGSAVAIPLAMWSVHRWLEQFAFRMENTWSLYLISVGGLIMLALFTLSAQTIKAALANPVKGLREE